MTDFHTTHNLYCKSCEHMDEVVDASVNLVVTSPPYWNAIDYEQHVADPKAWYRTRRGGAYQEYVDWLRVCFTETYKKQEPGGFCAVVIGTVLQNGRQHPVPQRLTVLMEEMGYQFHQEIVWHKVTGGVKRAGVTIQKPYPGYYCPNIMSESILVFQKPGPKIYEGRSQEEKEKNRVNIDGIFTREIANDVWHIAPVPPNHLPHPCPFPEEIPYRLILWYSYEGDLVLDPFAGMGTTAKVACALGRRFVGYEIHPRYVEFALKRLSEPLHLRDQLITKFEKWPVQDAEYQRSRLEGEENAQMGMPGFNVIREPRALYSVGERLEYQTLRKWAAWMTKRGLKMVVSPDLDGILCAQLLGAVLDWEVVGFYDVRIRNGKGALWICEDHVKEIESGSIVFIDHDINRRSVPSVGHHMLLLNSSVDVPEHTAKGSRSVNPNLMRGFTLEDKFDSKYPFGTIHFLLACYGAWGLLSSFKPSRDFLPVLIHADSSLQSAFTCQRNALEWLAWLGGSDDENSPIYGFCQVINRASPRRLLELGVARASKFESLGHRSKSQCHLSNPSDPKKWKQFMGLVEWVAELSGWEYEWPEFPELRMAKIELESRKVPPTESNFEKVLAQAAFSFALTASDAKRESGKGLSYSILPL